MAFAQRSGIQAACRRYTTLEEVDSLALRIRRYATGSVRVEREGKENLEQDTASTWALNFLRTNNIFGFCLSRNFFYFLCK
jgi:hypothetical protein